MLYRYRYMYLSRLLVQTGERGIRMCFFYYGQIAFSETTEYYTFTMCDFCLIKKRSSCYIYQLMLWYMYRLKL